MVVQKATLDTIIIITNAWTKMSAVKGHVVVPLVKIWLAVINAIVQMATSLMVSY